MTFCVLGILANGLVVKFEKDGDADDFVIALARKKSDNLIVFAKMGEAMALLTKKEPTFHLYAQNYGDAMLFRNRFSPFSSMNYSDNNDFEHFSFRLCLKSALFYSLEKYVLTGLEELAVKEYDSEGTLESLEIKSMNDNCRFKLRKLFILEVSLLRLDHKDGEKDFWYRRERKTFSVFNVPVKWHYPMLVLMEIWRLLKRDHFDEFFPENQKKLYASLFDFESFDATRSTIAIDLEEDFKGISCGGPSRVASWIDPLNMQFRSKLMNDLEAPLKVLSLGCRGVAHLSIGGLVVIDSPDDGVLVSLDGRQEYYKYLAKDTPATARIVTIRSDVIPMSKKNSLEPIIRLVARYFCDKPRSFITNWNLWHENPLEPKRSKMQIVNIVNDMKLIAGMSSGKYIVRELSVPELEAKFVHYSDDSLQVIFSSDNSVLGFDPKTQSVTLLLAGSDRFVTLSRDDLLKTHVKGPVYDRIKVLLDYLEYMH